MQYSFNSTSSFDNGLDASGQPVDIPINDRRWGFGFLVNMDAATCHRIIGDGITWMKGLDSIPGAPAWGRMANNSIQNSVNWNRCLGTPGQVGYSFSRKQSLTTMTSTRNSNGHNSTHINNYGHETVFSLTSVTQDTLVYTMTIISTTQSSGIQCCAQPIDMNPSVTLEFKIVANGPTSSTINVNSTAYSQDVLDAMAAQRKTFKNVLIGCFICLPITCIIPCLLMGQLPKEKTARDFQDKEMGTLRNVLHFFAFSFDKINMAELQGNTIVVVQQQAQPMMVVQQQPGAMSAVPPVAQMPVAQQQQNDAPPSYTDHQMQEMGQGQAK